MPHEFASGSARPATANGARAARDHSPNAVLAIELPEGAELRSQRDPTRIGPTEIGIGRQLPEEYRGDLTPLLTWLRYDDGTYVAVLKIKSPGAEGMRAGIRALATDGVVIHFFDPEDPSVVLPAYRPKSKVSGLDKVEVHWSPTVTGDALGIEVHARTWEAAASLQFEIDRLSHLLVDPRATGSANATRSSTGSSCADVPAACGRSSSCTQRATAKLSFVRPDGHAYVCTGTVINDDRDIAEKQNRALLHTAFHCIDSQGTAQSLEAEFHYGYEGCNGDRLDSRYGRYFGGADLLEALPEHDQSLIRLRSPLAVGGICFSGWDPSKHPANTGVLGLHHPAGRPKEAVTGEIRGYQSASFKDLGVVEVAVVDYTEGHTEGGSSGSGFFLDNGSDTHYLLGSLVGGPEDDCAVGLYGSLSDFYPRIRPYLRNETPPAPADDHGSTRDTATVLAIGATTSGHLESPDDVDYFSFTVDGDGEVSIESSGSIDVIGTLYDGEGRELLRDDDGGNGYNFSLVLDLAPGTYYFSVEGYEGEIGAYEVSIQFAAAPVYSRAIPLLLAAGDQRREGFLRIQNYSEDATITLEITGIDDWGDRYGPLTHSLEPRHSAHFNSTDIEQGNSHKGLESGLGNGRGDWRLQLRSSTPIFATSYVRTGEGFLTSIHDTALELEVGGTLFLVPIFNPASNVNQRSVLRITNLNKESTDVEVLGLDDAGVPGLEPVRFSIGGQDSVLLDSGHLEDGIPDIESGRFGDGKGKWQLFLRSDKPIRPASLMVTPQGHITNLSTVNFAVPSSEDLNSESLPQGSVLGNHLRKGGTFPGAAFPRLTPGLTDLQ